MMRRIRCLLSVLIIGVLPLVFINVVGIPKGQSHSSVPITPPPALSFSFAAQPPERWDHGWPIVVLRRSGMIHEWGKVRWFPWEPRPPMQAMYYDRSRPPVARFLLRPTTRWPFDDAPRFWRRGALLGGLFVNACVWCFILVGTAMAAARSRFVETGRLQLRLVTCFVAVTFLAGYLGAYTNGFVNSWEQIVLIPSFASSFLGYITLVSALRIRVPWLHAPDRVLRH